MKKKLEKAVNNYIKAFCEKHDLQFEGWVADEICSIGLFNDYYINFTDIIHDIDTNQPENKVIEWYDYTLEQSYKKETIINYKNYCKIK